MNRDNLSNMFKRLSIFLVILSSIQITKAQNYSISPGNTLLTNAAMDMLSICDINITNEDTTTETFIWNKLDANFPPDWEFSICDNATCYLYLIDNATSAPLASLSTFPMSIHCTPHITYGTAFIRYTIQEVNNPNRIDTLTWDIRLSNSGVEEIANSQPIIFISEKKLFCKTGFGSMNQISDVSGKIIFSSAKITTPSIELSNFVPGIYFFTTMKENKVSTSKFILQN